MFKLFWDYNFEGFLSFIGVYITSFAGVCSEMTPVTVAYTSKDFYDPNWEWQEFAYNYWDSKMIKFGKNDVEYKSKGDHSMQVYDWEILELFFAAHKLVPIFPRFPEDVDDQLVNEVKTKKFFLCTIK